MFEERKSEGKTVDWRAHTTEFCQHEEASYCRSRVLITRATMSARRMLVEWARHTEIGADTGFVYYGTTGINYFTSSCCLLPTTTAKREKICTL